MGLIALVGGDEFRSNCQPMDRWLLEQIKPQPDQPPRVAILPTAAAHEGPQFAARNGTQYFSSLRAEAFPVMVLTQADANNTRLLSLLQKADLIYLTGGDPWLLLKVLKDSLLLKTIQQQVDRGGIVAGSSAGAMVMAEFMRQRNSLGWISALGLVKRVAVLPHYAPDAPSASAAALRAALDPQITLLGIEEGTACVTQDGQSWEVIGSGGLSVVTPDKQTTYRAGAYFALANGSPS